MGPRDREITFEIEQHIGVVGVSPTGWKKELNMVAWNGNSAKYDMREWDEDHVHMSRGVTLNKEELGTLKDILNSIEP